MISHCAEAPFCDRGSQGAAPERMVRGRRSGFGGPTTYDAEVGSLSDQTIDPLALSKSFGSGQARGGGRIQGQRTLNC